MSRFAIVPYWRVLQQQQQTDSAFRYPGSGWMEELFGGCCLRFEKGGQRQAIPHAVRKLCGFIQHPHVHDAGRQQVHCREVGWWARVERIHASVQALAGAVSRACDRRCIPYGVGSVATEQSGHHFPTSNKQLSTGHEEEAIPAPIIFHGTHAPSPLPKSRRQPVPGKTTKRGWALGTGHVRPSRPRPSLPSLRCPAAGSHLSRNASRVGRDCETPMRIDPQGPHSSTTRPLSTRSIPT